MCIFIGCGEQTLWRDANECDVERKQMTTLIKHGEECSNRMKYLIQWTIYTMLLFTQILTTIFDSETDVQHNDFFVLSSLITMRDLREGSQYMSTII